MIKIPCTEPADTRTELWSKGQGEGTEEGYQNTRTKNKEKRTSE